MYTKKDKTVEDIHQRYGYAQKTIKKVLSHRKVTPRSNSESVRLGAVNRKRSHALNESYFKNWSREMAYIVGFVNADGNVIYSEENSMYLLQIAIKEEDKEVLLKIKDALGYEGELIYYEAKRSNGKKTNMAKLCINSKPLVKSLLDIGIEERKSLTKGVPHSLPENYIYDYLRGYFDGNGTIDMRYARTLVPSLRLRLSSGSERHLSDVQDILERFGFRRKKIEKAKGSSTYVLRFSNNETHTLYDRFYEQEESIHMLRRKEKFDYCVQQRLIDQDNKQKKHRRQRGKIQGIIKYT